MTRNLLAFSIGYAYATHCDPRRRVWRIIRCQGAALGKQFADVCHYDKDGGGTPAPGDIHYEVARHGDIPGEHTVLLKSADETLSVTHKVTDRRVFAVGAIRAARSFLTQAGGLNSSQDLAADMTPGY